MDKLLTIFCTITFVKLKLALGPTVKKAELPAPFSIPSSIIVRKRLSDVLNVAKEWLFIRSIKELPEPIIVTFWVIVRAVKVWSFTPWSITQVPPVATQLRRSWSVDSA